MQVGDIVLYKGTSLIAHIIQYLTKSEYTHASLVIGEDTIIEADRFIKTRQSKIDPSQVSLILRPKNLTTLQKTQIIYYASKFVGTKYDYISILKWLLRLVFKTNRINLVDNANRLYCFELIDRVYDKAEIDLVPNRETGDILVTDLLASPLLTKITKEGDKWL